MTLLTKVAGGLLAVSTMWAASAHAQVSATDAWARATVPGQTASGVFMTLQSPTDTRLVAAQSDAADVVEIHEMAMVDDVMRMREIPGLDLPAGQAVALKPGGYHIMLIQLKQPLQVDSQISVSLKFLSGDGQPDTLTLDVPVRPLTHQAGAHDGHHHGHAPASHAK